MKITRINIVLADPGEARVLAYVAVTFSNALMVKDMRLINEPTSPNGLLLSMPSRLINDRCPECKNRTHLRAKFCDECGLVLDPKRAYRVEGHVKLFADVCHPINHDFQRELESAVFQAYRDELARRGLSSTVA